MAGGHRVAGHRACLLVLLLLATILLLVAAEPTTAIVVIVAVVLLAATAVTITAFVADFLALTVLLLLPDQLVHMPQPPPS